MSFPIVAVYADGRRETILGRVTYMDFGTLVRILVHNETYVTPAPSETHPGRIALVDWLLYHFEEEGWRDTEASAIAAYLLAVLNGRHRWFVCYDTSTGERTVRPRLEVPANIIAQYATVPVNDRPDWDEYAEGLFVELCRAVSAGVVCIELHGETEDMDNE